MAFARLGSRLYIQGGEYMLTQSQKEPTSQFFSLDLSTSWPVSNVPWQAHTDGPGFRLATATGSPNNQTFYEYLVNGNNLYVYQINVESPNVGWNVTSTAPPETLQQGIRPVLDPRTGLVYIAGTQYLCVLNQATLTWQHTTIPPFMLIQRYYGGGVYNNARKSIMYHGGYNNFWDSSTYITEYSIDIGRWSNYTTHGDIPSPRSDHCMAIDESGTKIVVFGGRVPLNPTSSLPSDSTFSGDLYVLDIASRAWRKGASSPVRRGYAACIVVGDQFVAWGGHDESIIASGPPIVFDLTWFRWVDNYKAPSYYQSSKPSSSSSKTQMPSITQSSPIPAHKPSATDVGAITGGVVGVLTVIGITAGALVYKRRQRKREGYELNQMIIEQDDFNSGDSASGSLLTNQLTAHKPNANLRDQLEHHIKAEVICHQNQNQPGNPQVMPSTRARNPQAPIRLGGDPQGLP
ncbi:hypothetical protein BCR41DRAFT_382958 [Lobosporangium transversale]|uniref:Kelch repeat protein n=1 Tax=Lobosporangium transversale TaxID=64571 RepID=A0A1Y2H5X8_9FUNG|nr:hypothetical protein BCR41DRAFT_382958 [Lobosporangium transversale]ORZ29103.1 hypothetical protein BCR41DRAFT_382958 [Lobosporangium transversale]|eukprot:XP_021886776.1 hypothetical protein BCR41DRAFT_382958 [Lobosporangium transversale]